MSPFKNDAQRKAAFANMNARGPPRPKTGGVVDNPRASKKLVEKPKNDILKKWQDEQRNKKLQNALTWSGCLAFPDKCLLIKGVTEAYRLYKQNSNRENEMDNLLKVGVQNIATDVTKNKIEHLSKEIVKELNDSGFIDNICKETGIDKNTIEYFIEITTSKLLQNRFEKGAEFLFNNMW